MSNDFERLFKAPLSLQYQSTSQPDLTPHYRRVDPALTGYLIGAFILNPVLWVDPLNILRTAIYERSSLVSAQVSSLQQIDPA
jgi:hypothetical protein